jgi:hypothetical protein
MTRRNRKVFYSSEDWNLMQNALVKASEQLHRGPDHEYANRLARRVMTLFDQGLRDEEIIALNAAHQERLIARIGALRHGVV